MRNTVGLDISAETFDAVALIDGQTAYKKFQNNQDGIESLKNWINGQSIEDGQNIYIIMEATGNNKNRQTRRKTNSRIWSKRPSKRPTQAQKAV